MLFLAGGLLAPVFSNVTDSMLAKCLSFPIRYPFTVVANLSFVPVFFCPAVISIVSKFVEGSYFRDAKHNSMVGCLRAFRVAKKLPHGL
jgi:hypothetical protein